MKCTNRRSMDMGQDRSIRMEIAKSSITNAKSRGESGQPCLLPCFKEKLEEDSPFVRTEQTGKEYQSLIQEMNVLPKPNFCST